MECHTARHHTLKWRGAELIGLARGNSYAICIKSLRADLGFPIQVEVKADATAAIGICKRKGLGKIRHLATSDLWIQDKLRAKEFTLTEIAGEHNPADCLTKHLDRATLERHMKTLSLKHEPGRAASAPTI